MLNWLSKEFLLALCGALAIALISLWTSPPYQASQTPQIETKQQSDDRSESQENREETKAALTSRRNNNADRIGDEASEYWPWSFLGRKLKITDTLLVLFTFTLWLSTSRSARIAERALTELERPFVGIEITKTGLIFNTSGSFVMQEDNLTFKFANYGRTPATLTEMLDRFEVCGPNQSPTIIDRNVTGNGFPFGVIIGADRTSTGSTRSQSEGIDPNTWMTFSYGESDLFLLGFVRFRDIFDRRYITGFCLRFNKPDSRFLFDGDERYNYTRQEN